MVYIWVTFLRCKCLTFLKINDEHNTIPNQSRWENCLINLSKEGKQTKRKVAEDEDINVMTMWFGLSIVTNWRRKKNVIKP